MALKITKTGIWKQPPGYWVLPGFVVLLATIGAYLLIPGHAATPLQPSVTWTSKGAALVNANSGLCLGLSQATKAADGTTELLETCSSQNNQNWKLTWGSGAVKNTTVVNGFGQCLDDRGNPLPNGTIKLLTCNNNVAQLWSTGYGDGTIRIGGLCLGVNGNAGTAGSAIVLLNCSPPTPTVHVTAPPSGATVSGSSVTITATASVLSGGISSITLAVNGAAVATCTNTTTCSHAWDSTSVGDGSYTVSAHTTSSGGASAQASETVTVSNPVAPPPPTGGGSSQGGGTPSDGSGGSSGSDTTVGSSDTSSSSDAFSGVDSSAGSDTLDSSTAPGSDTTDSLTISGGSDTTNPGSVSNPQSSTTPRTTRSIAGKHTGSSSTLGIVVSVIALLAGGTMGALFLRRRRLAAQTLPPITTDPFAANTPYITPDPLPIQPQTPAQPAFPREDSAATAARLNWWMPDGGQGTAGQPPGQPSPSAADPPDMFEEGRKRLDDEEKRGQLPR
jgi:hypothetical protein